LCARRVYKVQALDAKGHVLRPSKAFSVPKPGLITPGPPGNYWAPACAPTRAEPID